jgi:hypothetical protein
MRRSGVDCSQHSPFRIVPQRGQVSENDAKPPRSEYWRVFHKHVAGSYFANDSGHLSPESATFSIDAPPSTGAADVLAREAARYHVNNSAPRLSVKGSHVIPNRERRENAVILSGDKYACGIGVDLDGADCPPSEEIASEYSSTSARE